MKKLLTPVEHLCLILDFFQRIETKVAVLLATNVGMLGLLALNMQKNNLNSSLIMLPAIVSVIFIFGSLCLLYLANFPKLRRNTPSIVFFGDIAQMSEEDFISSYAKQKDTDVFKGIASQIWQNSKILAEKFSYVKDAFICTAISILFWFFTLLELGFTNAVLKVS